MDLRNLGRLIRERRRAMKLTLPVLATRARVARSTLAALESGKLAELGFNKVARLCAAVDLMVDVQPLPLDSPLMPHRHLTDRAGRELTKAAIDDVISRGDVSAWRGLVRAIQADASGQVARRVHDVVRALREHDPKARAFALMLPKFKARPPGKKRRRG
jgi:transcriptional regulator with XRE-family HTH domain